MHSIRTDLLLLFFPSENDQKRLQQALICARKLTEYIENGNSETTPCWVNPPHFLLKSRKSAMSEDWEINKELMKYLSSKASWSRLEIPTPCSCYIFFYVNLFKLIRIYYEDGLKILERIALQKCLNAETFVILLLLYLCTQASATCMMATPFFCSVDWARRSAWNTFRLRHCQEEECEPLHHFPVLFSVTLTHPHGRALFVCAITQWWLDLEK